MTPESAEYALAAAVVKQAWQDARSPKPWVRAEALVFWANPTVVTMWDDLLGLNGALLRYAHALQSSPTPRDALSHQLVLF